MPNIIIILNISDVIRYLIQYYLKLKYILIHITIFTWYFRCHVISQYQLFLMVIIFLDGLLQLLDPRILYDFIYL